MKEMCRQYKHQIKEEFPDVFRFNYQAPYSIYFNIEIRNTVVLIGIWMFCCRILNFFLNKTFIFYQKDNFIQNQTD